MARMGKPEKRHMVDGEWVTIREVSERLGVSKNTIWTQMAHRGVSLGTLVRMYRDGQIDIGVRGGAKHMVRGRWTTIGREAERMGVSVTMIYDWMRDHDATLAETVEHYEAVARGDAPPKRNGPEPRRYWVNGRKLTIAEAAKRCGVCESTVRMYLYNHGCSLQTAVRWYENRAKKRAEREIMRILGY